MSTRRYYESNTGPRTGLRIPSIGRDSRGFEDTDQFFEASKKRMVDHRTLHGETEEEDEEDEDADEDDERDHDDNVIDFNDDFDDGGPDRQTPDDFVNSLIDDQANTDADHDEDEDEEEEEAEDEVPVASGIRRVSAASQKSRPSAASSSRRSRGSTSRTGLSSSSMSIDQEDVPSPRTTIARSAQSSFRQQRGSSASLPPTPNRSADLSRSTLTNGTPNRSNLSRSMSGARSASEGPSPARSPGTSSTVSSSRDRALDLNDYEDDPNDVNGNANDYEDNNDLVFDDGYDQDDDVGGEPHRTVIIEEEVGPEALQNTSARRHTPYDDEGDAEELYDPETTPTQGRKSTGKKDDEKKKRADRKGKGRARSEEVENDSPNGVKMNRQIIQRERIPLGQHHQTEIVERIPDEYHLEGMGDPDQTMQTSGPRRGRRLRMAPLEWWRGERARFGRPNLSSVPEGDEDSDEEGEDRAGEDEFEDRPGRQQLRLPVPVLKEVIRIPRAPDEGTFSGMRIRKKRGAKGKGRSKSPTKKGSKRKLDVRSDSDDSDEDDAPKFDERGFTRQPEDGWDEETDQMGLVWNVDTSEETTRRIACQRNEVKTRKVFNSDFKFEKVFGVDDFMAAGVIEIPIGGSKPVKPSKTNSYTFIVTEGAVRVRIHRSNFVMGPGGMFLVPKGNTYSIENVAKRESRLFFAQARDPTLDPEQARGATAAMINQSQISDGNRYAAAGSSPEGSKRARR
ncbi:mitotic fidelity of chromosome transmission- protein [Tilletia horrida]|nr:mitotic fidelity of chromosome transmission- protein [Tilletia horrida]